MVLPSCVWNQHIAAVLLAVEIPASRILICDDNYHIGSLVLKANSACYSFNGEDVGDINATFVNESLFLLLQEKAILPRCKVAVQILLLLSGDVELCPGPVNSFETKQESFLNRPGIKCLHLNVRGLWNNLSFVTEFLVQNLFSH